jgi:hypothetical protein
MIAGLERYRSAVPADADVAAQNENTHVEVVRMHLLGKPGRLTAINDFKSLAAQVAFKCVRRERAGVAPSA